MISAFVNAYNEEKNLPNLIKSLKDIDEIVLIDHESTDKTATIAKKLGARVYTLPVFTEEVTKYDVEEFERRFGWKPYYKVGDKIINWSIDMNENIKLCKNDWVLYIDCDERLIGDIKALDLTNYDAVSCQITRPNIDTIITKKLFKKSRNWFTYYLHQMIVGQGVRELYTDKISLEHIQVEKEGRKKYPKSCEFAFIKDNSPRMNYYLAREYFRLGEFNKSIKMFNLFLESANIPLDRSRALTLISGCLWGLGKKDDGQDM